MNNQARVNGPSAKIYTEHYETMTSLKVWSEPVSSSREGEGEGEGEGDVTSEG